MTILHMHMARIIISYSCDGRDEKKAGPRLRITKTSEDELGLSGTSISSPSNSSKASVTISHEPESVEVMNDLGFITKPPMTAAEVSA